MANLSLTLRYRPVRIGWCVRHGNWDDLRTALRVTHIFWGGKFNPIIPVGTTTAKQLVRQFRVDVLFSINGSSEAVEFTKASQALPWPLLENELVFGYRTPNFLDISHPLTKIARELKLLDRANRSEEAPPQGFESSNYVAVRWDDDDPLADILLATFGGIPTPDQTGGRDYEQFFLTHIGALPYKAQKGEALPAELIYRSSIADVSAVELTWDRVPARSMMGFYAGNVSEFEDVVNYWNLQASDLNVIFLDPSHAERMKQIRNAHAGDILKRYEADRQQVRGYASVGWDDDKIPIWSRSQGVVAALGFSKEDVPHYREIEGVAIGVEVKPPLHFFQRKAMLGSVADRYGRPTLSFQLPEKPFEPPEFSDEHFIVSLTAPSEDPDEWSTFWTPYIPSLNPWYGRQLLFGGRDARVEINGIGIVSPVTSENLTVTSLKKIELAKKLFESAGIDATPSDPGRIAARLISQLGGLSGCRVLKIAGVRNLIREYGPLQEFTRTQAISLIGNADPQTHRPRFEEYENLFIEERDFSKKLKPEDAFIYLLSHSVFRVGMTLKCTICELPFWISLDDASTEVTCEMCGGRFNLLRQLKTRGDWRYRRSGIFGSDNHQEGSIPVALTLHQLQAQFLSIRGRSLFLPNMKLEPASAKIPPCETDIFIAIQEGEDTLLAIGECKDAGGSISKDDATKMAAVADALSASGLHCYIIFSKTSAFTADDVENCRLANKPGRTRVIMLSDRELEPHRLYEKTSEDFEIRRHGTTMQDMAIATHDIFFLPRPKKGITPTDAQS
jgi:hypothetical protein